MTKREEHLEEIKDIETLYKNVESDLDIELTDREKVIIALLAIDYKGVSLVNHNGKISETKYIMLMHNSKSSDEERKATYVNMENAINKFAKDRGIEVYIDRSTRHVGYRESPIYAIHMNGTKSSVKEMESFFDMKASGDFVSREMASL